MSHQLPPDMNETKSIGQIEFRQAIGNLASCAAIVGAGKALGRRGLTVTSLTSNFMELPCLLVGINDCSETLTMRYSPAAALASVFSAAISGSSH